MIDPYRAPTLPFKVLWYVVVLVILALIVALVVIFYIPLIQQGAYGFTTVVILVIVNVVAAYLVHKKVLPRPSLRERILNVVFLAVSLAIIAIIVLVIGWVNWG